ncbi:MAG: hypothetical protein HY289_08475, partial [Planctomycetes bacterium]|nr:hypothetical protein [Planctomycetota bacterium]
MKTTSFVRMMVGFSLLTALMLPIAMSSGVADRLSASEPGVDLRLLSDD